MLFYLYTESWAHFIKYIFKSIIRKLDYGERCHSFTSIYKYNPLTRNTLETVYYSRIDSTEI